MRSIKGFTLVEVIITILILAIAAAAFVTYFGKAFTGSVIPAGQVQSQYRLIEQMEYITAEYRRRLDAGSLNLSDFKSTYVDNRPNIHESAKLEVMDLGGGYTTSLPVLQVTLKDGDQTLFAVFTE
jgi:prepilin-type N-terminal cleavage/methylation domain-containing protein